MTCTAPRVISLENHTEKNPLWEPQVSSDGAGETLTALLEKRIDRQKNLKTQRSYDKMLIAYIWLSVRTTDLESNIFPFGPPTQSISTYYLRVFVLVE